MSDQLTDLQARNTELVEENRLLRAHVAESIKRHLVSTVEMVREFMVKYNQPRADKPTPPDEEMRAFRRKMMREEYHEYLEASYRGDLVEMADALADMVYLAYGDALTYGIPLDRVIAEVHRSNMTKTAVGDGKKVAKGPDYQPPRIKEILEGEDD